MIKKSKITKVSPKPNRDFHYRIIKARIAETIIKELFQVCGFNVFEYGMERTVPAILGKIKDKTEKTALQIRTMPDFVVQNNYTGQLLYLEVKYRKSGKFSIMDLQEDFPYKNAWFIIVTKSDFKCISYKQLNEGEKLNGSPNYLLEDNSIFNLNRQIVINYKNYSKNFFKGVE